MLLELECNAVIEETGCGCDGQVVTWMSGCTGFPAGYSPEPLAHGGSCDGSIVDAGVPIVPVFPEEDAGAVDAGEDGCAILDEADAGVKCGQPCSFPGLSCYPGGPGDPIGVGCQSVEDGGAPIWFCSEG
jgi:hypothetical protein